MADAGAPLLRLASPKTLSRRKRKPNFPPPPDRVPPTHGRLLQSGVVQVRRHFEEARAAVPTLATDVPYVRVELAPRTFVTDAELRSVGLEPVYRSDQKWPVGSREYEQLWSQATNGLRGADARQARSSARNRK